MAGYLIDGIARGVGLEDLWAWYTDFRSDDVEIVNREAPRVAGVFENRKVTRSGNKVWVQHIVHYGGRRFPASLEITLHPERYEYEVSIDVRTGGGRPMVKEKRRYAFSAIPGGTRISAECQFEEIRGAARLMEALHLFTRMARKGSQEVMDAFMLGAEAELREKPP